MRFDHSSVSGTENWVELGWGLHHPVSCAERTPSWSFPAARIHSYDGQLSAASVRVVPYTGMQCRG